MELFDNIDRYNKSLREKKKPVEKLEFRTSLYNYLDNINNLIANTTITDKYILDAMNSNVDVMDGLYEFNSNSDLLWNNIRFIELLIKLFTSEKQEFIQLKVFLINNIGKIDLRLAYLLENSTDEDFKIKICNLIEIIYGHLIVELKAIDTINWEEISDIELYIMICTLNGQYSYNSNIGNPVAILNNFIIDRSIGDNKNSIIDLYYIFFGKNFSKVALENIYPTSEDHLENYYLYKHQNYDHMNDKNKVLYKHTENVLKATREIILSLTTPEIVKILRIIDSNRRLLRNANPTINLFLDEHPRIQNAIKEMHEYD